MSCTLWPPPAETASAAAAAAGMREGGGSALGSPGRRALLTQAGGQCEHSSSSSLLAPTRASPSPEKTISVPTVSSNRPARVVPSGSSSTGALVARPCRRRGRVSHDRRRVRAPQARRCGRCVSRAAGAPHPSALQAAGSGTRPRTLSFRVAPGGGRASTSWRSSTTYTAPSPARSSRVLEVPFACGRGGLKGRPSDNGAPSASGSIFQVITVVRTTPREGEEGFLFLPHHLGM